MHMRIDEPRNNELAAQVDDFRVRPAEHEDILARAHLDDFAALNSQSFVDGKTFINRRHLAVVENQVRILAEQRKSSAENAKRASD